MQKTIFNLFVVTFLFFNLGFSESTNDFLNEKVKLVNCEDFILYVGCDYPDEFDSKKLTSAEKEKALEIGLKEFEINARNGDLIFQITLAQHYYCYEKKYKKALYWANVCAKKGDSQAMAILWDAYVRGNGVIKDCDEYIKWMYLAAATGDEYSKIKLDELLKNPKNYSYFEKIRLLAKKWMDENPEAFFSPD